MIAVDMKNDLQSLAELRKTNDAFIVSGLKLRHLLKINHSMYRINVNEGWEIWKFISGKIL